MKECVHRGCRKERLPCMTVCEDHATPDAIRLLIETLTDRVAEKKDGQEPEQER